MSSTSATSDRTELLKNAGVITTAIDGIMEFTKGRRKSGMLLLGAAALSSRIPGLGTAVSVLLRAYRRFR